MGFFDKIAKFGELCFSTDPMACVNGVAGLAWLINAVRDAKQNGVSMSLYKMPEKLRKLAKISDADSFLPVE